jgi:hypothetical protein
MKRREFLMGAAAAASLTRRGRAQGASKEAKLARIGVFCSGVGGRLPATWDRSQPVEPTQVDLMDIPEMLADRFGLHNVEIQTIYFLSMEPSYYARFNERLKKAKCKVSDIPLELDDREHQYSGIIGPSGPDSESRAKGVELAKQWIDVAAMIGCPSVMVNQGSGPLTGDLGPCIAALKAMAAYGKTKNVAITVENRGRATPEALTNLIKTAGIYANPDLGNFPDEETRTRGMGLLIPLAHHQCHVKMNPRFDFAHSIRLAEELGFKGTYSIEGGGPNLPKIIDALIENT